MKRRLKELPEVTDLPDAVHRNDSFRLAARANVKKLDEDERARVRELVDVTYKACVHLIAFHLDPEAKKPEAKKLTQEQLNGPTLTDEA